MTNITMGGLRIGHVLVSAFSWTPHYRTHYATKYRTHYRIVLSWELLDFISVEDRIPSPFTNFITTPELSGPLYIDPDIYHTQITEYLLDKIHHWHK